MPIPNADRAVVDIRKLQGYALNPRHRVGQHKARLFANLLGITVNDAEALQEILLTIVAQSEAEIGAEDKHGQRYTVDFELTWLGHKALVRSAWIVKRGDDYPQLVTCYPLGEVTGGKV